MKPKTRRLILLAASVIAGGVLVLLDAPVHLVLLNTVLVGFIMLILLGMVRITKGGKEHDEPQPVPKQKEPPQKKGPDIRGRLGRLRGSRRAQEPKAAPAEGKGASRLPDLKGIPSYIGGVVSALSANLQAWRNKERETEKIDSLLDRAIQDPIAEDFPTFDHLIDTEDLEEPFDAEKRIEQKIDKLSSLTAEELKHLESEVNEKLFGEDDEADIPAFDLPDPDDGISGGTEFDDAEITTFDSIDLLSDGELPDPETVSAAGVSMSDAFPDLIDGEEDSYAAAADIDLSELDNLTDLSDVGFGDDDLSDLESINLDDIEPDAGGRRGNDDAEPFEAEVQGPVPIAVESPESRAPDEDPDSGIRNDIGSFGFGADDDADIMQMLKQETRRPRIVQDVSLLRDLKDVDVDTGELVEELESVLKILNKRS